MNCLLNFTASMCFLLSTASSMEIDLEPNEIQNTQPSTTTEGLSDSKRYNEVTFVTTHNAYANVAEGWRGLFGAHHQHSVSQQLQSGISALMLDIWAYTPPKKDLDIYLWHNDPNAFYSSFIGGPNKSMKTLRKTMDEIISTLEDDQQRIITLFFDDDVEKGGQEAITTLEKILKESGANAYSFQPHMITHKTRSGKSVDWDVSKQGWPTLGWLRKNELRLVMFTNNLKSSSELAFSRYYVLQNVFGNPSLNPTTYSNLRTESIQYHDICMQKTHNSPLFSMNHFPTLPFKFWPWTQNISRYLYPTEGEQLVKELREHVAMIKKRYGVTPNFIGLNYALGTKEEPNMTVMKFVEDLNNEM